MRAFWLYAGLAFLATLFALAWTPAVWKPEKRDRDFYANPPEVWIESSTHLALFYCSEKCEVRFADGGRIEDSSPTCIALLEINRRKMGALYDGWCPDGGEK